MIKLKQHTNIALGYFFIAATLGLLLRLFFVTPIGANFRYIIHAHSHVALLGWVYLGLTTLIYKLYFSGANKSKTYRRIFWFTNITIVGMLVTFPFQGYALFSIIFSTLFLIASYFFAWFVFKHIPVHFKETYSYKCIKASLWYMVVSSIGPWALGGIMSTLGSTSMWYKMAIYYYLHFQYNGWFILALCGIIFFILQKTDLKPARKEFKSFFWLINIGIILSFFLSVLWVEPPAPYYLLGAAGAMAQALAFYKLFQILKRSGKKLQIKLAPITRILLKISGILLVGKILLQLLTGLPYFAALSFIYTDFVIGYLHWVFLGVVSIALFGLLHQFMLLNISRKVFWIYFTGFVLSELLIFYKGTSTWLGLPFFSEYFGLLVGISALIPIGIGIFLFRNISTSRDVAENRE